jgi:lsr operon transcriptional repressor
VKTDRGDDAGRWSSEELLLRAAWYYYKDELTQDEIARRLSMSRASVGRLLDRARKVGLVSISLNTEYLDACELRGGLRETVVLAGGLGGTDREKERADHHAPLARGSAWAAPVHEHALRRAPARSAGARPCPG